MSDVKTQADVTDVRPLDLEAARIAVKPIVDAELQAERPVGCLRCIELQRDISALQSRCEAAESSSKWGWDEVATWKGLFKQFAHHPEECELSLSADDSHFTASDAKCTCGLSELLAAIKEAGHE